MLNVLIKPASSLCNMRCEYCFYHDLSSHRDLAFRGIMSQETADAIIEKAFAYARRAVMFAFQGGEPTLAGLDFFKHFTTKVKACNKKNIAVSYSLQTNGLLIDAEWAKFLRRNAFLVGLSFDGNKQVHDSLRTDAKRKKTYGRVLKAAAVLQTHRVEFNILSVITPDVARHIDKVYAGMKKHDFRYLQFIPCLNPLHNAEAFRYTLSDRDYLHFLRTLFALWYEDFMDGDYYSIRYFDNLFMSYIGKGAEQCGMQGHCNIQFVIEGDGTVYPCDFYCLDETVIGNIRTDTFDKMFVSAAAKRFLNDSVPDPNCKRCECNRLCKSGCKRYKRDGKYIYCEAFKDFYPELIPKLERMNQRVHTASDTQGI